MAVQRTSDGFVPTPAWLTDRMVARLFDSRVPRATDVLIDPGCGAGDFIEAVLRHCRIRRLPCPSIVGVELDPDRACAARARDSPSTPPSRSSSGTSSPTARSRRRITCSGTPPYVSLTHIAEVDRARFRATYRTATGRFDLYMLFFERALRLLKPEGRLSFVTPEKWLYVASARRLRELLAANAIEHLDFLAEDAFPGYVTYPLVTQLAKQSQARTTTVTRRDGRASAVTLSPEPSKWPSLREVAIARPSNESASALADLCTRIGCGPATGLDEVFLVDLHSIPDALRPFTYPTLSGRQLNGDPAPQPTEALVVPYGRDGHLMPEATLAPVLAHLSPARSRLEARSCASRRPWYAYHERPAMRDLLRPKLRKDIAKAPRFYRDATGGIVPRHSVYYLVPAPGVSLDQLHDAVSSPRATAWLMAHAQRAANGYLRLQSTLLKRLPVDLPRHAPQGLFAESTATHAT